MSWRIAAAIALAMLCVQAPARASDAPALNARGSLALRVTVEGTANLDRETRPISDLVDALDVFERERRRLLRRPSSHPWLARLEAADEQQLRLELRHGSHREPIGAGRPRRFAVPLAWRQLPAGRRRPQFAAQRSARWGVDIRSPGLPEHTRRLGDLRLECRADLYGGGLMRGLKPPAF